MFSPHARPHARGAIESGSRPNEGMMEILLFFFFLFCFIFAPLSAYFRGFRSTRAERVRFFRCGCPISVSGRLVRNELRSMGYATHASSRYYYYYYFVIIIITNIIDAKWYVGRDVKCNFSP